MERLDQELAAAIADATPASAPARVLLVGCHADIDGALTGWLRSRDDMSCHVHTFADATRAIDEQIWDVMLLDPSLPDGDGLELISRHQKRVAYGRTLVLSAELTAENVVKAMRLGASDYVKLPVATTDLLPQVEQILVKALVGRHRDERMLRLKKICTELNDARHEVSKQVDTLCKRQATYSKTNPYPCDSPNRYR
ncbi:MAG: response regulator, partial [Planctomycetota bacterium]